MAKEKPALGGFLGRYRTEMAAAGGMFPSWWQHKSSTEIAQAAIEAVREYKP